MSFPSSALHTTVISRGSKPFVHPKSRILPSHRPYIELQLVDVVHTIDLWAENRWFPTEQTQQSLTKSRPDYHYIKPVALNKSTAYVYHRTKIRKC